MCEGNNCGKHIFASNSRCTFCNEPKPASAESADELFVRLETWNPAEPTPKAAPTPTTTTTTTGDHVPSTTAPVSMSMEASATVNGGEVVDEEAPRRGEEE